MTWKSAPWSLSFINQTASASLHLKGMASQCQRGAVLVPQLGLMLTEMSAVLSENSYPKYGESASK